MIKTFLPALRQLLLYRVVAFFKRGAKVGFTALSSNEEKGLVIKRGNVENAREI